MSTSPLASAIAISEGYGTIGTIPTLSNNPGDLSIGDIGYGTNNGITIFPDASSGWSALEQQAQGMISGTSSVYNPQMTISQAGQIYANGDPSWAQNVASILGTTTNATLGTLGTNGPDEQPQGPGADTVTTPSTGILSQLSTALAQGFNQTKQEQPSNSIFGLSISRVIVIVIGIILIAAGVFSFKTTQTIVETGRKVAEAAAA